MNTPLFLKACVLTQEIYFNKAHSLNTFITCMHFINLRTKFYPFIQKSFHGSYWLVLMRIFIFQGKHASLKQNLHYEGFLKRWKFICREKEIKDNADSYICISFFKTFMEKLSERLLTSLLKHSLTKFIELSRDKLFTR